MLKRHLMTDHEMTPEQYRLRWELPPISAGRAGLCEDEIDTGQEVWIGPEGFGCTAEGWAEGCSQDSRAQVSQCGGSPSRPIYTAICLLIG